MVLGYGRMESSRSISKRKPAKLGTVDGINFDARRKENLDYHKEKILLSMRGFLEDSIKKATSETKRMNALIGLSGGLDSVVASYAVASSMEESIDAGRSSEANLALINFVGLENNHDFKGYDKRYEVIRDLEWRFPKVRIQYHEEDIKPTINEMDSLATNLTNKVLGFETKSKDFPGSTAVRSIVSALNEIGGRSGYATIDTTNGTEIIVGEFTPGLRCDISPISDLYKSSVFTLGKILKIPEEVLSARPAAFSDKDKPTFYFGELPEEITSEQIYQVLDPVLYWLYEKKKSPEEVASALGHSPDFVKRINRLVEEQKYKRASQVFCTNEYKIICPNSTRLSEEESREILEESMLKKRFEKMGEE